MRLTLYALALVLLSGSAPASAAVPTIYNLGTLGGTNSYGYAINASGQVAGYSSLAGDATDHAFLYTGTPGSGGVMADLGTLLGATDSYGRAINASGQVAGYSYSLSGEALYHAFLYTGTPGSGGAMADLGTLDGGALGSSGAYGVNDGGQVVGFSAAGMENDHAFLTGTPGSGGAMADLGTLGESYMFSGASGINAGGQVTGYSETLGGGDHAFLYTGTPGSGGAMADLGTLPGKTYSQGLAINDVGQVVGSSGNSWSDTTQHAFLYTGTPGSGGAMADLGTLGGTESYGRAINTNGQVVGYSKTTGGAQHAFLYTGTPGVDGHMIDLDAWLDANNPTEGAKWTLLSAAGVTDTGLITGQGNYNDGHGGLTDGTRAFLLDASALVSTSLPGDYNHDGKVDAADYLVWRKSNGSQSGYNTWRSHFGQSAGSGAALPSVEPLSAAVPEPATIVLFGVGLAATFGALSQRSKSRRARHRANHRQPVRRPRVEPLEDRCLLSFSPASFSETSPPVVWAPPPPLVADFTSDGILDKISSNSHEVLVRPGRGDGTFGDPIRTSIQPTPRAPLLAVADFNGDNRLDVFTAAAIDFESPPKVNVILGLGDGRFIFAESFSVETVPTMIGTGEIFGTGRTDVAIAGYDYLSGEHGVLALFNDGHWWRPSPALPGDYNGNDEVDAADYIVWRKTLGSGVTNYSGADGNGNGVVDQDDQAVWRAHFGETLPAVGAVSLVAAENVDNRKLSASLDSVVATQQASARVEPTEHEQQGSIRPPGTSERDVALSLIDARLPRFIPQTKATMRPLHALPTTKSDLKTRGNDLLLVRSAAAQFDQHASERGHDSRLISGSTEEAVETRLEALDVAFTTLAA